eukprot:CAMPEP_0172811168 /NCGR_PEP_ID=MMETSP1075-20121228/9246_1 /TAXON_ID=2916 /ORGANISM="Ceratium fusus, Strain PA161109" /LENGTH=99 /DNA_ID=CAMNT_0013650563 /DNA_START=64 /DNA_END=363 /DNA_ORIENTATION=+
MAVPSSDVVRTRSPKGNTAQERIACMWPRSSPRCRASNEGLSSSLGVPLAAKVQTMPAPSTEAVTMPMSSPRMPPFAGKTAQALRAASWALKSTSSSPL